MTTTKARLHPGVAALLAFAATFTPGALQAAPAPPEVFAVVIGWNGGTPALPPLRFADDDAARFATFFRGLATPDRPGRVWLFTELDERTTGTLARAGLPVRPDGPPTRDAVLSALRAAATEVHRPGTRRVLYVVYAGHGLHGRVLLKPTGGDEAALTGGELRTALAAGGSGATREPRVFVFLDACRSESLFSERGDQSGAADFGAAISALEGRAQALPIGVLTAAHSGRPAGEVARLEAGYFSHVLGSGLAGGADADGDDVVSFAELAAFVAQHTRKLTGQIPWFDPPGGDLDAGTIDHRGRTTRLVLPADAAGRFLVSAGQGRPVFAEAYQDRGRPVRLTLPPGRYRVEQGGQPGRVANVDLGTGGLVDLGAASWSDANAARGPEAGNGDDALAGLAFSSQFSSDAVFTLTAGFLAGRERSPALTSRTSVAAEMAIAAAPLGLSGIETELRLRVAHPVGPALLALVGKGARSAHVIDEKSRRLWRLGLGVEAGLPVALSRTVVFAPLVGLGWGLVLLQGDGDPTAGDLRSPFGFAGARVSWHLGAQSFVSAGLSYEATFISVDNRLQRSDAVAGAIGAGVLF